LSIVFVCCVVLCRSRPLRRADNSSRGALPCVCMCVIKKPRKGGQRSGLDYKHLWMNEWMNLLTWFTRGFTYRKKAVWLID
jgi:hypothetical protein